MNEIVFFLEERSARELIDGIVRRIDPEASARCRFVVFEGKQDLERHLKAKIQGYLDPKAHFIVMRDQDRGDCKEIKARLANLCKKAKKKARIRIACRTIEAFYLADLAAVEVTFRIKGLAGRQEKERYRRPDHVQNPVLELEQLTRGAYQKVGGSRALAEHLDLDNARSNSFYELLSVIRAAVAKA